jgi:hypothetical protein
VQERGVPTVTIVSEEFVGLAEITARSLGYPAFPIVTVPHPFGDLTEGELRSLADDRFEEIVRLLARGG